MQQSCRKPEEYIVVNADRGSRIAERVCWAGTSQARRKGLRGVEELSGGAGLWISPCEAIHTFGMKVAIDAIFLDRRLHVRKIQRGLPPGRISICFSAESVIEVAAGAIARSGTAVGDRITFQPAVSAGGEQSFSR